VKQPGFLRNLFGAMIVFACLLTGCSHSSGQSSNRNEETIVMIRHGEKPAAGLGQLDCKGLNRALALPSLLIGRFGKPDSIYAPNPSVQVSDHSASGYSYVRPLATIEPTAIRLGMPVDAQIGYDRIDLLEKDLLQPAYAHSLVFVAWEHAKLRDFAVQMIKSYGTNPAQVPDWPGSDYETIYVFHITRSGQNGAPQARLEIQQEGLTNSLSDTCPGPK
jgi:hypothetical protein